MGRSPANFEQTAVQTFKKIVQIGRAAMLNDDVAPFLRTSNSFGISAGIAEADVAYATLEADSTLNDGLATFHTTHGNLMDAAPPTVTSLTAAVAALRSQVDNQGRAINLTPSFVVVPVSVEIGARQAVISIYGSGDPDAPRVLAEPRLTANWYLTCAQTERPALHLIARSASPRAVGQHRPNPEFRRGSGEMRLGFRRRRTVLARRGQDSVAVIEHRRTATCLCVHRFRFARLKGRVLFAQVKRGRVCTVLSSHHNTGGSGRYSTLV